jgi:helicase required for RNAi-mediated heterochromatin assembly 1
MPHEVLPCAEPCRTKLDCGHGCHGLCGQECFCDCKKFKEAKQAQATKQPMSLKEKMLFMGAEETRMLKASLSNPGVPRQQAQPTPTVPTPGQAGFSRGGRNGRRTKPAQGPIQAAETAAQWGQFVNNIEQHDEELLQKHLAPGEEQVTESVIQEVYQPTSLANGQRTGGGSKIIQQIKLPYNKVAAAPVKDQSSGLQSGIDNLTLTNESHHGNQPAAPPGAGNKSNPNMGSNQPARAQPNRHGGKGGRKSAAKNAAPSSNAQPTTTQQPLVELTPVHTPTTQPDLLTDDSLVDTPPRHEAGESNVALLGFHMAPFHAQAATLAPSSATSTAGSSVTNETSQSMLLPTTPVDIRVQAQTNEERENVVNNEEKKDQKEEEEEWLIEL